MSVPCRDERERRAFVNVTATGASVVLVPSRPGALRFEPLRAGRLRGLLRNVLAGLDQPAGERPRVSTVDSRPIAARVRVVL